MFRNYLKTAFRSLWKNKVYGFLNIIGLSIGIACAGLIFLWVENELTYNHYFKKSDRLFSVKNNQTYDGTTYTWDATPGPLADGIKSEIPGIKSTSRSTWGDRTLFGLGEKRVYEQGLNVDASFFTMFNMEFVKGNPATAFSQLHALVISQKMAKKFFGDEDPVGKYLTVNNKQNYVVSGVVKDLPENSSIQFEWLAPFKIYEDQNNWLQNWGNNGIITYVETEQGADMAGINKKLNGYIQTKMTGAVSRPFLFPMKDWRLYNKFENGKQTGGRIKYVKLFTTIAWIILIIACINFMNLATARSERRAREVGVRKVVGAQKGMLVAQFIGEAILLSYLSVLVALLLIWLSLPSFNILVEKELSIDLLSPAHLLFLGIIGLVSGLVAGSYPAFYLSSFKPILVLKGLKIRSGASAGFIRKGLVIAQFSISIILIISTIIIYQQIQHVRSRELGYDKENLIYMNVQGSMNQHFGALHNDLLATGVVKDAALSNQRVLQEGNNSGDFSWQGKDPNKQVLISMDWVSPEYINTMGMKLKEGRNFYSDAATDSNNIIINDALARLMGKGTQVGSVINRDGGEKYTVVGVVNDFLYNDMYASSAPLIVFCRPSKTNYLNIRIKTGVSMPSALSKIEAVIKNDNPGFPVEYKFVDLEFDKQFKAEMLIGKLASIFSALAILISCLGLFGLAAYTAERRTREVGIRKVLGASTQGLAQLLSRDFVLLVILSCLIAFPVSWYAMHNWLLDFAYRIEIQWWVFIAAGASAIAIALLTVSYQAIKAASLNPVKSLRTE